MTTDNWTETPEPTISFTGIEAEVLELLLTAEDNGHPMWDHNSEYIAHDIIEQTGEYDFDRLVQTVDNLIKHRDLHDPIDVL